METIKNTLEIEQEALLKPVIENIKRTYKAIKRQFGANRDVLRDFERLIYTELSKRDLNTLENAEFVKKAIFEKQLKQKTNAK